MPERTIMTREKMDELVADAVTMFPNVQLDPEVTGNLELAQELSDISNEADALIRKTVDRMEKQLNDKAPLLLMELGLLTLAPRIDKRMDPSMPIVSATYAVLVSTLVGTRYVQERGLAHVLKKVEDLKGAKREFGDLKDFEAYLDLHWESAMRYLMCLSKKDFLTSAVAVLKKHIAAIDAIDSGELT